MRSRVLTYIKSTLKCIYRTYLPGNIMDKYTKTILTVIAVALVVIAAQNTITPAKARGDNCGSYMEPCFVKVLN